MGPQRVTHSWATNTFILPRSKCLLILWVQSPSKVILEPKKMKSDIISTFCPYISYEVIGRDAVLFVFWMLRFKPAFLFIFYFFIAWLQFIIYIQWTSWDNTMQILQQHRNTALSSNIQAAQSYYKPAFLVSSFTFIKRLFSSSSLSAIKVISPAYLIVDIFPSYLDSSLCFIQPGILHDVVCMWFSRSVVPNNLWPHGLQHIRLHCLSPSPGGCSDSCWLSQWCHLNISSSVAPFSSSLLLFPALGSFPMGWLFA